MDLGARMACNLPHRVREPDQDHGRATVGRHPHIVVPLVSPLWLFGLAFGGQSFAGVRPLALSAFDIGTGGVMLALAAMIIGSKLGWL